MIRIGELGTGVRCVAWSSDGTTLGIGVEGQAEARETPQPLSCLIFNAERFAFIPPTGSVLLAKVADDGTGAVWHWRDWRQSPELLWSRSERGVRDLAVSRDGSTLAMCGWEAAVHLFDVAAGPAGRRLTHDLPGIATALTYARGGALVIGLQDGWLARLPAAGRIVELPGESAVPVVTLAAAPDVPRVAAGRQDGSITVHDLPGGEPVAALRGHELAVYGLAFTPDGRRLVSGGADGTARVWDWAAGRQTHNFRWHQSWLTCLAVSPDGTMCATGSDDETVAVWDVPD